MHEHAGERTADQDAMKNTEDDNGGSLQRAGSVVEGKTAQQWHDAWLLCATGRELEWAQLCELTACIASVAERLKAASQLHNYPCTLAYRELQKTTQSLWLTDPENCEHKMPKRSLT